MDRSKDELVNQLEDSIQWHYSKYQRLTATQWAVMISVAAAGVLTTAAGSSQGQDQWFSQSSALVAWGAVVAIGAGINQIGNPGKAADNHLKEKLALKAIKGALEFRELPVDRAEELRVVARTNPEEAVESLNQWSRPEAG